MSLFNESLAYAVDSTAVQVGDLEFSTKAGAAVTGAVLSGLNSIYNTGASVVNALGGDVEMADTSSMLEGIDSEWAQYYKDNKHAIDTAGFIGTSILPGMLAIKGLKAVQAGNSTGAFGRALSIPITGQANALKAAAAELETAGGTVFTRLNANKMKLMGWEFADQALQAAAFELGVALTMKQSPLLADDSWWDISKTMVTGALLGGAVGGTIGSLIINKDFKTAIAAIDKTSMDYQAVTGFKNLAISDGDKAFGLLDAALRVPEDVLDGDKLLKLAFHVGGSPVTRDIDITKVLKNVATTSTKNTMLEFETKLRELASGRGAATGGVNPEGSEAIASFVLTRLGELKKTGASVSTIRDDLGGYLQGLRKVTNATEETMYGANDLHYFKAKLTPEEVGAFKTVDDLRDATVRNVPFDKNKYDKPYIWLGTPEELSTLKLARIGAKGDDGFPSVKAAWEAGYHMAQQLDGTLNINTTGGLWHRVTDPVLDPRRFLNTRTGAVSDTTVLTAADRVVTTGGLKINYAGVEYPVVGGVKRFVMNTGFKPDGTVEYMTARHAWAAKLTDDEVPGLISSTDISLLERAAKIKDDEILSEIKVTLPDGSELYGTNLHDILLNSKIEGIKSEFLAGNQDIRALAYNYATEEKWIEKLVGSEFGSASRNSDDLLEGMSRNLEDFLRRENVVAHYERPQQFTAVDLAVTKDFTWEMKRDAILQQAGNAGGQFVTGELAYTYRVQQAVRANQNASAAVLGAEKHGLLPRLDQAVARLSNTLGAGASFLGAANANYGDTLGVTSQAIGKLTNLWKTEATEAVRSALSPVASRIINNPKAAAEVGIVNNLLRNTGDKYVRIPGTQTLILKELATLKPEKLVDVEALATAAGKRTRIDVVDKDAWDYIQARKDINATNVERHTVLVNARGHTTNKDPTVYYPTPIDTNYYQHFAFVRSIEGKAFGTSEVSMVFGRDAAELQRRIASVDRNNFEVITKDAGERYHKAKGDYDFDQTLNERTIDSELRKTGALAEHTPDVRAANIVEDDLKFYQNQASKLVRNAVESNYAQQIAELRGLGATFQETATSVFGGIAKSSKSEITNPFDDYVKTMLDVSKRSEYTFFHQANEFVDALGTRAYRATAELFPRAKKGEITYQEANKIAEQHGIKGLYSSEQDFAMFNIPRDRNLIKEYVAKANTVLGNLVLRLDFIQPIMNVISTPILLGTELASIKNLAKNDPALLGALSELTNVKIPGQAMGVPSTTKLIARAIESWHGPDKLALIKRYSENGDMKAERAFRYHEAVDNLSMSPNFKVFSEGTDKAVEKMASLSNWAEDFTRFASADVMRQLTEPLVKAGKLDIQMQNTFISTFVNRVQGNYITSQRPVVFQGVLGSAIGLFQTYSFNLLQQLLRHVENKDTVALATMFGMQAGLFGLNGTPMFDAVNTHLIGNAAINKGHYDAYSLAPALLGKEVGDWLMYGTASAFPAFGDKWPSLYSRGDINPRHMTILPMTPTQIPAIDASIKFASNLVDVGKKLIGGADVSETLLQGLEHNGINRPLAGIAQSVMQHTTTSKGSLISASSDFELLMNASRIAGAKPMDEAVALNNMYRLKAYQVADIDRMGALGETVKTALIGNRAPSDEDFTRFMRDYTKIGGRPENFHQQIQRWSKEANTSVVENMRKKLNSTTAKRLNEIMGATPLEDYRSQAVENSESAP